MTRRRRGLLSTASALLATGAIGVAVPSVASAADSSAAPASCSGVIAGQGEKDEHPRLTKALVGFTSSDGRVTMTFELSSSNPRLNGEFHVRDCAFPQGSNHATFGSEADVSFHHGAATISLTVPADQVNGLCDRAEVSPTDHDRTAAAQLEGTTHKSNVLCPPRQVVPDTPAALLLLPVGLVVIGIGGVVRRRRATG